MYPSGTFVNIPKKGKDQAFEIMVTARNNKNKKNTLLYQSTTPGEIHDLYKKAFQNVLFLPVHRRR